MNLATENKGYINKTLSYKNLAWLIPVLETGQAICSDFINTNKGFFDCEEYLNILPGHLLTYSINKQLKAQCLLKTSPFSLQNEVINEMNGYTIPMIKIDNITLTVLRSRSRKKIENNDKKYLKERCKKNIELNAQISMFNNLESDISNFHGVLVYSAKKDWSGIEFADIIFPNEKLSEYYHDINLKSFYKIYNSDATLEKEETKSGLFDVNSIISDYKKMGVK